MNHTVTLTELLGSTVYDAAGVACGRVREVALTPQEDRAKVSTLIVRTRKGNRVLPFASVTRINGGVRAQNSVKEWASSEGLGGLFLLERDLLDQQVIDVNGRKVVRVNDVDLHADASTSQIVLKVGSVDVGARGAVRRLLKGVVPAAALHALLKRIPERPIPWEFVDVIETDPARRVKLKISHDRLAKLHPADIADIVEELAPDEREAVFETLDEGGVETVSTMFLVDPQGTLVGTVPLAKLVLAEGNEPLLSLVQEPLISCRPEARENEVAELFDKYNLVTLPVVDENKKLVGVVT